MSNLKIIQLLKQSIMKESLNQKTSYWNERWIKYEDEHETKRFDYYFSDYGRIKSVHKITKVERILRGSKNGGFSCLYIRFRDSKSKVIMTHIFVAENFIGKNPFTEPASVIHINGDKTNNHFKNLKWATKKESFQKMINAEGFDRNIWTTRAKLTESKVRMLKKFLKNGKTKKTILAKQFGITTMQINRIERGENWAHVK